MAYYSGINAALCARQSVIAIMLSARLTCAPARIELHQLSEKIINREETIPPRKTMSTDNINVSQNAFSVPVWTGIFVDRFRKVQ
jgi:hypothetical protein